MDNIMGLLICGSIFRAIVLYMVKPLIPGVRGPNFVRLTIEEPRKHRPSPVTAMTSSVDCAKN